FTPRAVMLLADIQIQRGQKEEALKSLSEACDSLQGSVEYPNLVSRKAQLLEEVGQVEEAKTIYESVRDNAPSEQRSLGVLGLGRLAERDGKLFAARDLYREAVDGAPWGSAAWNEAVEEMGRLNVQLIFSPEESEESRYYTVESGDSLINIGIKLNTTQGLLAKANNINDVSRLTLGQRIKYTPKEFRIVIERSTCSLYLLDSRGLFKRYHVGLGKTGHETALGSYVLGNKQKDPTWFKPGAGPIPAGSPENELGSRWMPMVPVKEGLPTDLGIHGTIAPDTVGQYSSMGCARMTNTDVEELFDLVVRSTPVDVVDVYKPEDDAVPAALPEQHAETQ
ncbi:MAG TPA: L,D-transpeptidase family protein, partial [Candidatus Hydrogenedentes bacterium]|nr:L,D-transpeptidase family protein [Candidatus Hydrogenedentota bacterium]